METNLQQRGEALLEQLKSHVLATLESKPECQPGGIGLGNAEIERTAGLALHLDLQDHWLCWSILKVLEREHIIERVGRPSRWRTKSIPKT
jgi:hypothetical protein